MRLRHAVRLAFDVLDAARLNRLWWLPPMVAVLAVVAAVIAVGQAAVPVSIYTLF
jgi:hypothetical protein